MLSRDLPLALTFDDVLLVPRASSVLPAEVDVGAVLGGVRLHIPIVSSAMDTVTEGRLAAAMASHGGLGVVHKNLPVARQAEEVRRVKDTPVPEGSPRYAGAPSVAADGRLLCGAALGVGGDRDARVRALVEAGVDLVVIDTAHGHSRGVLDAARAVKDAYPQLTVVAGNIATAEAAEACFDAGADVVKVGVGPGSICTTRIVAGTGVPQVTAIADCAEVARARGRTIVADGGIRSSGDVAKAIAAGAHAVMIGSLFAGTDEAPGSITRVGDRRFKTYRGMGSMEAMEEGSADRYFQERNADPLAEVRKLVPEGVVARVPARGPLADVVYMLVGGLRAAMGYSGAADLEVMRREARFVRITSNGLRESHVHDVDMIEEAPNYSGR
ncbi:MAG: IMP dehydrogenase [Alphaproteobacteria bacterium]|nr:IMP dehydrogenase [Alphaproteobacteria bacterium]